MGVEYQPKKSCNGGEEGHCDSASGDHPLILGLLPSALVDHVAKVDWSLLSQIPGKSGGSFPVLLSLSLICLESAILMNWRLPGI